MLSGVSDEKFHLIQVPGPFDTLTPQNFHSIFKLEPSNRDHVIERRLKLPSFWFQVCRWHQRRDAEILAGRGAKSQTFTAAMLVGAVLTRLKCSMAVVLGEDSLSTHPRHSVYLVGLTSNGDVIGVRSVVVWA